MNWQVKHDDIAQKITAQNTATGCGLSKDAARTTTHLGSSWTQTRTIISRQPGKYPKSQSMLNNEGTIIAVHQYLKAVDESK